ncbi:unnamed protein product [Moneuplotes crassus]|uniref:Uncharacterized protein n=1 Tax=Euplotes crassus TaxID=5936 RepID=A0AAD1XHG8_EUPCR|nr:unnamed protein product [Moneuplotes crassus]
MKNTFCFQDIMTPVPKIIRSLINVLPRVIDTVKLHYQVIMKMQFIKIFFNITTLKKILFKNCFLEELSFEPEIKKNLHYKFMRKEFRLGELWLTDCLDLDSNYVDINTIVLKCLLEFIHATPFDKTLDDFKFMVPYPINEEGLKNLVKECKIQHCKVWYVKSGWWLYANYEPLETQSSLPEELEFE